MSPYSPDSMVLQDDWSDLRRYREIPEIDFSRLHSYRLERIKSALREAGASMFMTGQTLTIDGGLVAASPLRPGLF